MKKEKGVLIANRDSRSEEGEPAEEENRNDSSTPAAKFPIRNASSKYDFVKVKVWLGENADHYYVLSRFLLSRMLTVTKIPNHVAIKIALELKKLLVDNSLLDVSQSDLEANLFKLMERRGFGEDYINRYKMMTRFHHQRVPLVILVCGTACVGKSTIATQLAQRLNLPNVLQTDMVYELLRTATDAPLTSTPVWAREFSSPEELITEFCRECRIVRKGLNGDLKKAMKDGKPIIIEGIHLDPSIYLMDDENKSPNDVPTKVEEPKLPIDGPAKVEEPNSFLKSNQTKSSLFPPGGEPNSFLPYNKNPAQMESNSSIVCGGHGENQFCSPDNATTVEGTHADPLNKVLDGLESVNIAPSVSDIKGETIKDPETDQKNFVRKKSGVEPIIVPIVLKMADFDHEALLEEWISTRTFKDKYHIQDKDKLISNLKTIQDYLCSFVPQGLTIANVSPTAFPQTLDWLHSYLLQCIEQGISPESSRSNKQPAEVDITR